jgi:Transcriptional regulator
MVAVRSGATARELSGELDIPIPTVYRLLQELVRSGYLVHLKKEQRFELGYRLHDLGVALHEQVGVPAPVRKVVNALHLNSAMAAYYAVYRGIDVILAYVSDCGQHPRARPLDFGFHEAAHATAFGKIMLAGMPAERRQEYLQARGMPRFTDTTMVTREQIESELSTVATCGIAWESAEFLPGMACGAVGVYNPAGMVVGAVAVSAPTDELRQRRREVDRLLREYASQLSRYFRSDRSGAVGRGNRDHPRPSCSAPGSSPLGPSVVSSPIASQLLPSG